MPTPVFSTDIATEPAAATLPPSRFIDLAPLPKGRLFFLDVNKNYGEGGDQRSLLSEDDAIKGQIGSILSTPLGSEPFEPEFGSLLPWRIHEPINQMTAWLIENDTITAVSRWLVSRIKVARDQCFVRPLETEEGYAINLTYQVLRTKAIVEWNFSVYR